MTFSDEFCLVDDDHSDISEKEQEKEEIFSHFDLLSGALLVKLFQYYKWTFVKFLYEDNPKPFQECQVLLRPIAHTFALNQIRSDNRKITSNDIKDNFKSIFIDFISNNASGNERIFSFVLLGRRLC